MVYCRDCASHFRGECPEGWPPSDRSPVRESYGELWCSDCAEPADGPDGLCAPHREGVPAAITDPWLAKQRLQGLRRALATEAARNVRISAARAARTTR